MRARRRAALAGERSRVVEVDKPRRQRDEGLIMDAIRIGSSPGDRRRPHGGSPARHDDPQRRAPDGHHDPHAVQLPRPVALRRLPRLPGRAGNAARAASWSPRAAIRSKRQLVVHTETESVKESRRTVLELLLAQAPESTRTGRVRRRAGRRVHAVRAGGRGQVHPLRAVRARVQRDDGPRARSTCSAAGPRGKSAPAFDEPTDQCQACGACVFVCPTGRRRPGARSPSRRVKPHLTALRPVPHRPAVHRPGPSAGLAARAGHRPRQLRPLQDRRVRAVLQGLPGRGHRLRPGRRDASTSRSAASCSRPASRRSTPPGAASSASASPPTC